MHGFEGIVAHSASSFTLPPVGKLLYVDLFSLQTKMADGQ